MQPPAHDNSRNTVIFFVAAALIFVFYQVFVMGPAQRKAEAEKKSNAAASAPATVGAPAVATQQTFVSRPEALARSPRVPIETPSLKGSISLKGAVFDDLFLTEYKADLDRPEPVELFRPEGVRYAWVAQKGWAGQNLPGLPDNNTLWTLKSGTRLAPGAPVVLSHDNGAGLIFERMVEVDDKFMFTITDTVVNRSAASVTLTPYASVQRVGLANPRGASGVHEGRISVLKDGDKFLLDVRKYAKWAKDKPLVEQSTGGWLGITDKYWIAALIPDQSQRIEANFQVQTRGQADLYEATYAGASRIIPPNFQIKDTTRLLAGAKRAPVLRDYEEKLSVPKLEDAIDWTNIYFITKPIFWLIEQFYGLVGNFGIAILMMTVVVKIAFFYPANLSFESMTKMKKVQPQLEKLKAQHQNDPAGMQQAMMKLYREEKINPLLGCLPMLATIPVFLGLFYVLNVTIEMRHAPFYGWIRDLSAPDPTTIWNLFGLLPYRVEDIPLIGGFMGGPVRLGVWPLLYGFTMWLTQSMSPPAADPMQQKIIMWMPVIFTLIMGTFASGLLIYYVWSNLLTILQQYVIMRRFKVDNPIDAGLRRLTGKPKPAG